LDPSDTNNRIHRPYIGATYDAHRIVIVGQNLYDHGDWDALISLYAHVLPSLADGRKRMRFGDPKYRGTLVYHRAAIYARIISEGRLPDDLWSNPSALADAATRHAFINAVKCSPHGDRSAPLNDMPQRCVPRFLIPELLALAPRTVVCLYKVAYSLLTGDPHHVRNGSEQSCGPLLRQDLCLRGMPLTCLYIPHPAAPGGSRTACAQHLAHLIRRPN
jgi:hypothetical protein